MKKVISSFLISLLSLFAIATVHADSNTMKPFVLAHTVSKGDMSVVSGEIKSKLTAAGFEVVGEYSPYETVHIIAITNDALKQAAAASEYGAYVAAQRVSLTQQGDDIQIAYTNPVYMSHAYRMDNDLGAVKTSLADTLGVESEFGPEKGLVEKKLRKYHYMFGMPYVDDADKLATHASYEAAVAAVESGLTAKRSGVSKVYRIDIPGKDETVFGVGMTQDMSSDAWIMSEIDFKPLRSSAHLPYEILVKGDTVYALNAKFRIAINFPDLKMMGKNSFMKIRPSPGVIKDVLSDVARSE